MARFLIGLLVVAVAWPALGQSLTGTQSQTQQTSSAASLSENSPQENATGGSVATRAPGKWVQAAIARHKSLMQKRLSGPRFGERNTEEAALRNGNQTTTGTQTGLGGLADLLSLASQFASTGSLSGLGSLLGGLTGPGSTTGTGSTSGTGTTIPGPSNGTSYTLEDLIRLGQMFGGSTSQSGKNRVINGATQTTGKDSGRSQQTTQQTTQQTQQIDFKTRWANAMLQTFFSAVTLGLQSSQFIDAVKDFLRPLVLPPESDSNGSGSGDGTGGGGSGSGNGNGIEDLPPSSGSGGNSTL